MEQMENEGSGNMIGMALFLLGWLLVGYSISTTNGGTSLPYAAALVIAASVMMMKKTMKEGGDSDKMKYLVGGFVAGWLLLAYSIRTGQPIAFVAALLVFASMLYFLPQQRDKGIVDGPGLPLFVIAWGLLIVANSPKLQGALAM